MKQRTSVWSMIALFISLVAFALYALILDGRKYVFIPWIILSLSSVIFPTVAKYFRNRYSKKGKALEIAAMVIGFFDFHFVFSAAPKIRLIIVNIAFCIICILYAKLFNNVEPISKKKNSREAIEENKIRSEKRQTIFNGQRPDESNFGISPENPLCSASNAGTDAYLDRLRTADGRKFTWQLVGGLRMSCNGATDVSIDKYQLFLDGQPYKILFFAPCIGESTAAPHGMQLYDNVPEINNSPANPEETPSEPDTLPQSAAGHATTVKVKVKKPQQTNSLFCRKCGSKLAADSVFCIHCGTKV